MKRVVTETEVHAHIPAVWRTLTDFEHYVDWNPTFCNVVGDAVLGSRVTMTERLPDSKAKDRVYRITRMDPNAEMHLATDMGKGVSGETIIRIAPIEEGVTRVTYEGIYDGFGLAFMGKDFEDKVQRGFQAMGAALKKRIEKA